MTWATCPGFTLLFIMTRQYYAILDTETTIDATVADFAIVICDKTGSIVDQLAVLVYGEFDKKALFYDKTKKENEMWSRQYASKKQCKYFAMLDNGQRSLASVAFINAWIQKAIAKYNPSLTAYNLSFDKEKCRNTGIDLSGFADQFCLWQAAFGNLCKKAYRQFVLENHLFNPVTEKGNMSFKTTAESVFGFLNGEMIAEPHTALEDARDFELPILVAILKKRNWRDNIVAHNWKFVQVKDFFKAI